MTAPLKVSNLETSARQRRSIVHSKIWAECKCRCTNATSSITVVVVWMQLPHLPLSLYKCNFLSYRCHCTNATSTVTAVVVWMQLPQLPLSLYECNFLSYRCRSINSTSLVTVVIVRMQFPQLPLSLYKCSFLSYRCEIPKLICFKAEQTYQTIFGESPNTILTNTCVVGSNGERTIQLMFCVARGFMERFLVVSWSQSVCQQLTSNAW